MTEADWYYLRGREQVGPLSLDALREEARDNRLLPEDYVWCSGWPEWVQAGRVTQLSRDLAPASSDAAPAPGERAPDGEWSHYRSERGLVSTLTALMAAYLGASVVAVGLDVYGTLRFPETWNDLSAPVVSDAEVALAGVFALAGLVSLGLFIAVVVVFCKWIYRANRNAHGLGARDMAFTPGWSVGWFFIPIMNLFRPYQAVSEIHRASDPGSDATGWQSVSVGWLVPTWWGLWLLSGVASQIVNRLTFSDDPATVEQAVWLDCFAALPIEVAAGVAAIAVVRTISNRQQAKAERLGV